MSNYIGYLVLGLGNGAVFAALALALVVTYRSSGVINFATGSIALYAAYMFGYMRQGRLLVLIPGLPNTISLGFTAGFWVALLLTLVASSLLGLLLYGLVFRPLRTAPPVARVVASLGIQLALVLLVAKKLGTKPLAVKKIYPQGKFKLGDTVVRVDRIWFAATVVAVALIVGALFKFTRFGLATRAAAESEKGAVVSRISPTRIAALNWMLSAVVAGVAGVLIAPLVSLVPISYTLFIVPALAAAVLSRFEFLSVAVGGGLLIGMFQSETEFLKVKWDFFPSSGASEMIPLILILLVLVVRGKPLPARGTIIQRTLGRAPRPRNLGTSIIVGSLVGAAMLLVLPGVWRNSLILSVMLAMVALSLVVVTGYAGQISFAQLTLAGAAAYTMSTLTNDWHVPFPIAPILAALVATAVGVVVGLPALRVRGLSVAVVTLALAVAVDAVWFRNTDVVGSGGLVKVGKPSLFGLDLSWRTGKGATELQFGFMVLVVLALLATGVALLRRSPLGTAMLAVRANERSAAAAGVDVVKVKLMAFAIASFIAGIGGSMLAYRYTNLTYDQFTPIVGLGLFATVYLAGITSVSGGIAAGMIGLAGIVYQALNQWLSLGQWYQLITATLLVVSVIFNPEGLVGPSHVLADRLAGRRRRKRSPVDEAPPASSSGSARQPQLTSEQLADLPTILSVRGVRVAYGGVVAVSDVSFDVPRGAIVGLIGPNGAGKTTLVDAISGFARCSGSIEFDGRDLTGLKPHRRVKLGLSRTFQAIELYDDLTVQENLEVGLSSGRGGGSVLGRPNLDETFEILGLSAFRDRPASDLSQGQRQLVSIGRALVGRPELVLLDEPAAGLDSAESQWLGDRLRDVRDTGVSIVMVDHDVNLVLSLCDFIIVLDFGVVIAKGAPAEIRKDRAVVEAYLGRTHTGVPE